MKTSENLGFRRFGGYGKETLPWNGLSKLKMDSIAYFFRIFITIFKWRLHILEERELQVFKYFSKRGAEKSLYILGGA